MVMKATTTKRTVTTKVGMQRRKALPDLAIEDLVRLESVIGSAVVTRGRGKAKIFRAATKMRKRKRQSQPSKIRTPNQPEVVASK